MLRGLGGATVMPFQDPPDSGFMMKRLSVPLAFAVLCACSSQGVYEGIQTSNRLECNKVPPSQYEECLRKSNKPYSDYDRERKEALER